MTLLETATHAVDQTGPIIIGLLAFGLLMTLLAITLLFGSSRPHTSSR